MKRTHSIAEQSIFGEYEKNEDKVTAALLQILKIGGPEMIEHVFDEIDEDLSLHINTQVSGSKKNKSKGSRPDGEIQSNFHIYIESKTATWDKNIEHNGNQLSAHVQLANTEQAILIYITPDKNIPTEIYNTNSIYWTNWENVIEKLKSYQAQFNNELITFLTSQFELMISNVLFENVGDGYNDEERVIIVAGRWAEPTARDFKYYECQKDRYFRNAKYLAFYTNKRIKYMYEIKKGPWTTTPSQNHEIKVLGMNNLSTDEYTVFLLTGNNLLSKEIKHNSSIPYVRGQRYTSISKIMKAATTDDL